MKPIEKDELFNHLSGFLKTRGIELTEGSYSNGIQKTCSVMADAINLGQQGLDRAKVGIDKKLDQMRQVIHEKTAPKTSAAPPKADATKAGAAQPPPAAAKTKPRSGKKTQTRKRS